LCGGAGWHAMVAKETDVKNKDPSEASRGTMLFTLILVAIPALSCYGACLLGYSRNIAALVWLISFSLILVAIFIVAVANPKSQ